MRLDERESIDCEAADGPLFKRSQRSTQMLETFIVCLDKKRVSRLEVLEVSEVDPGHDGLCCGNSAAQPNSFQSAGEAIYPLRRSADRLVLEVAEKTPVSGDPSHLRFAEMGCGEARPNPAGNETGAHQAVDGADDVRRRPVERAAAGGLQRSPPDGVPPLPAREPRQRPLLRRVRCLPRARRCLSA